MTPEERFWSKVSPCPVTGCWWWMGSAARNNYGQIRWNGRVVRANRIAFMLKRGRWPRPCALHRCDQPSCVNPDHIFEGSQADNVRDMWAKGRAARLPPPPQTKFNESTIRQIRSRYAGGGISQSSLANEYGVLRSTICRIIHGERWRIAACHRRIP